MKLKKLTIVLFALVLCSCAAMQLKQDKGMKGLLYAKNEIASLAEEYTVAYQNASVIAQLNWKRDIDPLFLEAERVLNEWEYLLKIGSDTADVQDHYMFIREAILKHLVEIKEG